METGEIVGEEAICATDVPRASTGKLCREGPRSRFLLERRREGRGCPRFTSRLLPSPFPGGCQMGPASFRHVPSRSDLAISCWKAHGWLVWVVHDNDGSCVTGCVHMWCSNRWETTPLLPEVQVHSLRHPTINPASSLFLPSIQVLPVAAPPASARLALCQHDEERMTDHLLPFPTPANTARGRCKERSMWRWGPGASASSLSARTSSCLSRRNRTCTVTLLAVHAASEHEEGCDGSFHARRHRLPPLCAAVLLDPPHDARLWASVQREDRISDVSALVVGV